MDRSYDYEGQHSIQPRFTKKSHYTTESIYNPRIGFVKKVYGILSFQLLITASFIYLACKPLYNLFIVGECTGDLNNPGCQFTTGAVVFFCICTILNIIIYLILFEFTSLAKTVPINYFLLLLFTICESYIVGMITTLFSFHTVILAAFLTLALTIALTIYACLSPVEVNIIGGIGVLCVWSILSSIILVVCIISGSLPGYNISTGLLTILITFFYGLFLVIDTQLIMDGSYSCITLDDYIIGALIIYLDIVILFIKILEILGRK